MTQSYLAIATAIIVSLLIILFAPYIENPKLRKVSASAGFIGTCIAIILGICSLFGIGPIVYPPTDTTEPTSEVNYPPTENPPNVIQTTYYRSRNKEFEQSSEKKLDGWTRQDQEPYVTYGSFGPWQYTPIDETDSIDVETKTRYKVRTITTQTVTGEFGEWTTEHRDNLSPNIDVEQRTITKYPNCYFKCPNCYAHMHGWDINCPTWAGGCGTYIPEDAWVENYFPISWDDANFQDWYGTGHYYTIINGERWFKWIYGSSTRMETEYRYRENKIETTYSDPTYSDEPIEASDILDVVPVTAYRSRTKTVIYTYWRWTEWSEWTTQYIAPSDTTQVETKTE